MNLWSIVLILLMFILSACSGQTKNLVGEKQLNIKNGGNVKLNSGNSLFIKKKQENLEKENQNRKNNYKNNKNILIQKIKQEELLEQKEEREKIKNLDFSMCDEYKGGLKENCYMKIVFSKYNKQGCNLLKNKNRQFYEKCLEIKKGIETWKKLRKYQYYYEEYGQDNY